MNKKRYPAIGILGGENISALYGVDNGLVDWQGVGIQHFFYKTYEQDLIHSAVTYLRHHSGVLEIGNRKIDGKRHPVHQHPILTKTEDGFLYQTTFISQENSYISWKENVFATKDDKIVFETEIFNSADEMIELEVGGYIILRNPNGKKIAKTIEGAIWEGGKSFVGVYMNKCEQTRVFVESPTGFVYRTMQQLQSDNKDDTDKLSMDYFIGVVVSKQIILAPKDSAMIQWGIIASDTMNNLQSSVWNWNKERELAQCYWKQWLETDVYKNLNLPIDIKEHYDANLVAVKASLLDGFVPADITGHYFSFGSPCYYARDAMMIARALLLSGHYQEVKEIMQYLIDRPTKNNSGEFYQRYNAKGEPREGANNNVFHQLDSQGYFLRNLLTYYERTGEWLLTYESIKSYVNILKHYQGKNGLIGPEGGVNEGVFGPAYITSSNMFIYGGLQAAIKIASLHGDENSKREWTKLAKGIKNGIETTWIEEQGRYGYGYMDYCDELVQKYDTPQYFGPLYGYPIDERFKKNNSFLLQYATFFDNGIGYTEQEYHHGPWLFNTGACAQVQALLNNFNEYWAKVNWMIYHSNGYCLMPEAIDAEDEEHAFINPLTWACAEFVSTISILSTSDGFTLKNEGR